MHKPFRLAYLLWLLFLLLVLMLGVWVFMESLKIPGALRHSTLETGRALASKWMA
ncbi:MAG: hypothetical protein AB9880_06350 [Christensenellales bacterium]